MSSRVLGSGAPVAAALAFFTTASVNAASPPVTNQEAESSSDADALSEIVVTARRVEERAQDVPISITVFNQ